MTTILTRFFSTVAENEIKMNWDLFTKICNVHPARIPWEIVSHGLVLISFVLFCKIFVMKTKQKCSIESQLRYGFFGFVLYLTCCKYLMKKLKINILFYFSKACVICHWTSYKWGAKTKAEIIEIDINALIKHISNQIN